MHIICPEDQKTINISFDCDYCGKDAKKKIRAVEWVTWKEKSVCFCSRICAKLYKEEHDLDDIINGSIPKEYNV